MVKFAWLSCGAGGAIYVNPDLVVLVERHPQTREKTRITMSDGTWRDVVMPAGEAVALLEMASRETV